MACGHISPHSVVVCLALLGTAWHCLALFGLLGTPRIPNQQCQHAAKTSTGSSSSSRKLPWSPSLTSVKWSPVHCVVKRGLLCKVCAFAGLLFSKAECNCSFFFFCPSSVSTMPAALSAGRLPSRSLPFAHPCHHGHDH